MRASHEGKKMVKTSDDLLCFMAELLTKEQAEIIFEKARNLDPTDGPSDEWGMARITLSNILDKISRAKGKDDDWLEIFVDMQRKMKYGA